MQILCRHKHPTRASANLPRAALDALLFLNTRHKHKMANAKPLAYRRSLVLACLAEAQEDSLKAIEVRAASLPKYFAKALKHPHGPCACTCQLLKTSSCWANWPPPPSPVPSHLQASFAAHRVVEKVAYHKGCRPSGLCQSQHCGPSLTEPQSKSLCQRAHFPSKHAALCCSVDCWYWWLHLC